MSPERTVTELIIPGPISPSEGEWWQSTEYQIHQCKYSENRLYINQSDSRVLIVPTLDREVVALAATESLDGVVKVFGNETDSFLAMDRQTLKLELETIIAKPSILSLGILFNHLLTPRAYKEIFKKNGQRSINHTRFDNLAKHICYHFWLWRIIAMPTKGNLIKNTLSIINPVIKSSSEGLKTLLTISKYTKSDRNEGINKVFKLMGPVTNFRSPLDFDDVILAETLATATTNGFVSPYLQTRFNYFLWSPLEKAIYAINPSLEINLGNRAPASNSLEAIGGDDTLKAWLKLGQYFIDRDEIGRQQRINGVRYFLKYLLLNPSITRDPKSYFDKSISIDPIFHYEPRDGDRKVFKFLESAFRELCCVLDDNGQWVCIDSKRYAIPMAKPRSSNPQNNKTGREVMPAKLVQVLKTIVLENDFAWPKSLKVDYFITDEGETKWYPGRAIATLLRLTIPCRNKQLLTTSSGDGDTWRYEAAEPYDLTCGPAVGIWLRNTGRHAPTPGKVEIREGVFRREPRWGEGGSACYLFFNNNKTADLNKEVWAQGYVMPWDHPEAQGYLLYLRDWQEQYNPAHLRVSWSNVRWLARDKDLKSLSKKSDYFLFRDPCNQSLNKPQHPMTDTRLRTFWNELMLEAERRLNIVEGTPEDPAPYRLITVFDKVRRDRPVATKYDLHSMRVTILSYLHDNGVPLEFLRQLAGHSSLVMANYYSVINPEKMVSILKEATTKWKGMAVDEWALYLKGVARERVKDLLVARDDGILEQVFAGDRDGLVAKDHGLCPVGESMCDVGLESFDIEGEKIYLPVPGGKSNCVRCRYFCSGPAWLPGLVAHFNWLTLRLTKESRLLDSVRSAFNEVNREYLECIRDSRPFLDRKRLEQVRPVYDTANAKTNEVGHSWQATYQLIEAVRELARRETENPTEGMSLVVQGGAEAMNYVLQKCHPTDLLAKICATASLYPGVSQPNEANQDLCCVLDRLLFNNKIPGILVTLGEEERRVPMLEIWKWLRERMRNDDEFADVVECRATLESLGFLWEFEEKLRTMEPFSARVPEVQARNQAEKPSIHNRGSKALSMRKEVDLGEEGGTCTPD